MSEVLRSVGLDVGTTSTQLIVSELTVENRASGFAVPEMEIMERKILYKSPVYFTPLLGKDRVDGPGVRKIVEAEYRRAGITRDTVDTGAVIITGETSRKENARSVLDALAELAGDFVVATAGPDLESVLAAKGSGAVDHSRETGQRVLHMDIGGGTTNLALLDRGRVQRTGCLNIGGRLIKLEESGRLTYVSPVLRGLWDRQVGEVPGEDALRSLAGTLTQVLEMAAGLRHATSLLAHFLTEEADLPWEPPKKSCLLSFSGGVADCISREHPPLAFGDLGPLLGSAIRESALCAGDCLLKAEAIRATVIGAGCHSAQLSGSTVFHQNIRFPMKNLPVVELTDLSRLPAGEEPAVLALPGLAAPSYRQIVSMAEALARQPRSPLLLCLEQDMAKALGQALAVRLPPGAPILCIDRVRVREGSFLDIGAPVSHALPVVVKTLVLGG